MFGFFKKKTKMQALIAEHGYEKALAIASQSLIQKLPSRVVAYEFMLQELDGASLGSPIAQLMANTSGILPIEFKGALDKNVPEIDEPHDYITNLSLQLADDRVMMTKFRLDVGSEVMKHFKLGRHHPEFSAYDAIVNPDKNKNYVIKANGFKIKDLETTDILDVVIRDGRFHGEVVSARYDMRMGLMPWSLDANPFTDDQNFFGNGNSPKGPWDFSVTPSASFSQILSESAAEYEWSM